MFEREEGAKEGSAPNVKYPNNATVQIYKVSCWNRFDAST